MQTITTEIEKRGGQCKVTRQPVVTSNRDDTELQRMLEDLQLANAEVSGDEDSEAYSDSGDDDDKSESDGEPSAGAGRR